MSNHKFFPAAVLGLATLCVAGGASAQSITEVTASQADGRTVATVRVRDLDLTSTSGQEALYRRLSAAAEKVCGSARPHEAGSVKRASRNGECQDVAVSRAMARVNGAAVAAR